MKNLKIRIAMLQEDIKQYEVAAEYGLPQTNFSKLLNTDLNEATEERIFTAIAEIAKRKSVSAKR